MSTERHEHHFPALMRSRDHLTRMIQSLKGAVDQMGGEAGDDWIIAKRVLHTLVNEVAPQMDHLREASSDRFDRYSRMEKFKKMQAGEVLFPDERRSDDSETAGLRVPSAKRGAELAERFGGLEEALLVCRHPAEIDDLQAHRLVQGERLLGWSPPVVFAEPDESM